MALSERQRNELWNLKATLEDGVHDDGRPLSESARAELRDAITHLEEQDR